MSVRSDNFHDILAMITASDKKGVVAFMRSQGINVNANSDVRVVYKSLHTALVSSEKFKNNFVNWASSRYQSQNNASGEFDPLATQSGGFTPMSTQFGTNLKEDDFVNMGHEANAGGQFDPMNTQSGGFSPISTQMGTNLKEDDFANMGHEANASGEFDPMNTQSGGFTPISTQFGTNLKEDDFANASGQFDPMNTQRGGFSPISTQMGTNLKEDDFANMGHEANASGEFDPMNTQSGGFTPISTQFGTNLKEDDFANMGHEANAGGYSNFADLFKADTPYDPSIEGSGSKIGNLIRGINIGDTISNGIDIWKTSETSKQQQKVIDGQIKAKELELQALAEQGKITQQQLQAQLELARLQKNAPQSTVVLYVIGGIVLLAGIGTAVYFATRKK